MREEVIGKNEKGQRLDKYLAKYLRCAPKSFIYKMLRKKNILLNNQKAKGNEMLKENDLVRFYLAEDTIEKFSAQVKEELPLEGKATGEINILYEDQDVLLLEKPVGMLSQKAKNTDVSAVEEVISYLLKTKALTKEMMTTFRPGVCNRLDRNTSGILAAGKSLAGLQDLSQGFKNHTIQKYYHCIVWGRIDKSAYVHGYLKKDPKTNQVRIFRENTTQSGQEIKTEYEPICFTEEMTYLRVHLLTGRTHQIRAHLAYLGHPIVGDPKYGNTQKDKFLKEKFSLRGQLLHGGELIFPKDSKGALKGLAGKTISCQEPVLFQKIARAKGLM